jgi:hypothetical protein
MQPAEDDENIVQQIDSVRIAAEAVADAVARLLRECLGRTQVGRPSSFAALVYCSRSSFEGLADSARFAGIHIATRPSSSMVKTTPPSTSGSREVA